MFLKPLTNLTDGTQKHANFVTKNTRQSAELIAIIRAFDYVIHPYLTNQRNVRGFNIEVAAEAYKMVSEGVINSLNGGHPSPEIVEKPLRETIEEMERNKTPV